MLSGLERSRVDMLGLFEFRCWPAQVTEDMVDGVNAKDAVAKLGVVSEEGVVRLPDVTCSIGVNPVPPSKSESKLKMPFDGVWIGIPATSLIDDPFL